MHLRNSEGPFSSAENRDRLPEARGDRQCLENMYSSFHSFSLRCTFFFVNAITLQLIES